MASVATEASRRPQVTLERGGLRLGDELVPLYAGAVHYWRLEPQHWRPCLSAVREMGLRLIDLYVPWSIHELSAGQLDFGQSDPRCDVVRFLELVAELGLLAIVRPGPHINAELTNFGLPDRVIWDPDCQARSPQGHPVILPVPPRGFPVPSHGSRAYLAEACRYLRLMSQKLAPLRYPAGPIVLLQVDNEGAMFFRDGPYDQDYHPDAIAKYRSFLADKYGGVDELRSAYGSEGPVLPPTSMTATDLPGLARHLDWMELQEELIVSAFAEFAQAMGDGGLAGVPLSHNLPMAHETTALNPARLSTVVDLVGLDFYGTASESERAAIARRTTEAAARCAGTDTPVFACEMGAGFPPYFPPLGPDDSAFTVLTSLAYGLRGFNVFMAVNRDRWVGAPVDGRGQPRPFADFWRRLVAGLERVEFHHLHRRVPVRLVVPRCERRLARALHAFGPVTPAVLAVMGGSATLGCMELDLGLGYPLVIDGDQWSRLVASSLDRLGIPFAWVAGEDADVALGEARWIITVSSGGVDELLQEQLDRALARGVRVSFGPHEPRFDGMMRPLAPTSATGVAAPAESVGSMAAAELESWILSVAQQLELPRYSVAPDLLRVTVHEDERGTARVAFVVNPTSEPIAAQVDLGPLGAAVEVSDLLQEQAMVHDGGTVQLALPAGSVAVLALR